MGKQIFLKGPALLALARRKARGMGVGTDRVKLVELIHRVQEKEGHTPCFRERQECPEKLCCWQMSCGARIIAR